MSPHTLAIIWRVLAITAIATTGAVIAFANVSGLLLVQEYDAYFHFGAFAGITLLAVTAFPRVPLSYLLVGLALLGGLTELLQFMPAVNRQPDWRDFGFDVLGIDTVIVIVWCVRRFFRRSVDLLSIGGAGRPVSPRTLQDLNDQANE